jgi:alkylated DNA repair dioxygenase AlkB
MQTPAEADESFHTLLVMIPREFKTIDLDRHRSVSIGKLRPEHQLRSSQFEQLWALHPHTFHEVQIFGKMVPVPRWSETYGRSYHFSGTIQLAQPFPDILIPLLAWSRVSIDERYNGLLLNWYDGALSHRIGAHRNVEKELVVGAPIVTISFGESRIFRLRKWKGDGGYDIEVSDGSVLVIPYDTNMAYTHEVPASKANRGRRISVTIRAFTD